VIEEELRAKVYKSKSLPYVQSTLRGAMGFESAYPIGLIIAEKFKMDIKSKDWPTERPLLIWAAQKDVKSW
jgi:hypothetical protein